MTKFRASNTAQLGISKKSLIFGKYLKGIETL